MNLRSIAQRAPWPSAPEGEGFVTLRQHVGPAGCPRVQRSTRACHEVIRSRKMYQKYLLEQYVQSGRARRCASLGENSAIRRELAASTQTGSKCGLIKSSTVRETTPARGG